MEGVGGHFFRTSRDVRLEGGRFLAATCETSAGEWLPSTLDLNFFLANIDGVVKFAGQRPGLFLLTSDNVTLTGAILQGNARRINQTHVPFELDLDHNVANIEGRLLWLVNPAQPYNSPDNDEGGFGSYDASNEPEMANDDAKYLATYHLKRDDNITPPSPNDEKDIQNLVRLWDFDLMDRNLGQTTLVTFPRNPRPGEYRPFRQGWRIDNQENGSFPRNNLQYYSLAVQNGRNVYSSVLVPVRYRLGRTRIRNAFLQSMKYRQIASIDPPPPGQRPPLPSQNDPKAEDNFVQSLGWRTVIVGQNVLR